MAAEHCKGVDARGNPYDHGLMVFEKHVKHGTVTYTQRRCKVCKKLSMEKGK